MPETRTIYDLGVESSIRWAKDQQYLDQKIVKESPFVSLQTTVDVYSPFFTSEFDILFQTQASHLQWALFQPPTGFNQQKMRLFTYQIIPSLGPEELQQTQVDKIRQRLTLSQKKRQETPLQREYEWEAKKEEEEENKESKTLTDLLEYLGILDKLLSDINARRSQYSKG